MVSEGNVGEYFKFLFGVGIDYIVNDVCGVSFCGLNIVFIVVIVDGILMFSVVFGEDFWCFEFE